MENDGVCDNNNTKSAPRHSLNCTVEDAEAKDSDNKVSWFNDIDTQNYETAIS